MLAPRLLCRSLLAALALAAAPTTLPAQDFTKITGVHPTLEAGGGRASSWSDVDGDGDLDLYVTRGGALHELNLLYRNDGGVFALDSTNAVSQDSLRADGASWGDYDGDGDDDLFVVSWYGEFNGLFENQGGGAFTRVTTGAAATTGTFSEDCAWNDYDQDGDLDLFVANSNATDNLFYRNDGGGALTPLTVGPVVNDGNTSRHGAFADYDNDGDVDLFVTNESNQANKLYRNELVETGTATFVEVAAGALTSSNISSMSASWGDYDNDGDLDIVVANYNGQFNTFFRNELTESGSATFTELVSTGPSADRGWSFGTHWADFDNDADLDLVITNGFGNPGQLRRNFVYRNDGGTLLRITSGPLHADQGWSFGASFGDYDDDGDLDFHVATWIDDDQQDYLYRNEAQNTGNHWLAVDLVGTVSNTSGIGARIRAKAIVDGSPVWQMREVAGSDGYCSHNLRQHLGLRDAATVDSLVVNWPSGIEQVFVSVAADQRLTIVEPSAVGVAEEPSRLGRVGALRGASPNPFRTGTAIEYEMARAGRATLTVHDVGGRLVRSLAGGNRAAGTHGAWWDGHTDAGVPAAAGVYFARLSTRTESGDAARVEALRVLRLR